jgi:hypothetical protein
MQFMEDDDSADISISNMADWMKFNTPTQSTSNDPFKIEGEELSKVSGLGATFRRKMNLDLQ